MTTPSSTPAPGRQARLALTDADRRALALQAEPPLARLRALYWARLQRQREQADKLCREVALALAAPLEPAPWDADTPVESALAGWGADAAVAQAVWRRLISLSRHVEAEDATPLTIRLAFQRARETWRAELLEGRPWRQDGAEELRTALRHLRGEAWREADHQLILMLDEAQRAVVDDDFLSAYELAQLTQERAS